jgi:Holliday junction resolvase RusA-like endonuclease
MTDMGFWKDDALICIERIAKYYSDEPGIAVRITECAMDWTGGEYSP